MCIHANPSLHRRLRDESRDYELGSRLISSRYAQRPPKGLIGDARRTSDPTADKVACTRSSGELVLILIALRNQRCRPLTKVSTRSIACRHVPHRPGDRGDLPACGSRHVRGYRHASLSRREANRVGSGRASGSGPNEYTPRSSRSPALTNRMSPPTSSPLESTTIGLSGVSSGPRPDGPGRKPSGYSNPMEPHPQVLGASSPPLTFASLASRGGVVMVSSGGSSRRG
jgi:hypothetical protein